MGHAGGRRNGRRPAAQRAGHDCRGDSGRARTDGCDRQREAFPGHRYFVHKSSVRGGLRRAKLMPEAEQATYVRRRLWFEDATGRREIGDDELLRRPESLIILGEAGMGKTRLLRRLAEAANTATITARKLTNRPHPNLLLDETRLLIIDALDEVAATGEGDAVDRVLQKLGQLEYPRFILACRVADWQAATSIAGFRDEYREAPLQLHLLPLTQDEQLAVLGDRIGVESAKTLQAHFESFGLDFLGNPQTLELVASLPKGRPPPASSSALLTEATNNLLKEHKDQKATHELPAERAIDAAGAAFAGLILSGSTAIVRKASANRYDGEITVPEIETLGGADVTRVLGTRLFAGSSDRFTYWHRRIGEFLGATWLAKQANTPRTRKRLLNLFQAHELVPANLRGLHAWLARDPKLALAVIEADPMGLIEYGDADTLGPEHAECLFAALISLAIRNPRFRNWRHCRAASLVSGALTGNAARLLEDKTAPLGLRLLVAEQMIASGRAQPFAEALRSVLNDPDRRGLYSQSGRKRAGNRLPREPPGAYRVASAACGP